MERELWQLLGFWLLLVNGAGFALMGWDKRKARRGAWRTPERVLLLPGVLGGAAGVLLGMRVFRHKTRRRKFAWGVPALLAAQLALGAWLCLRIWGA